MANPRAPDPGKQMKKELKTGQRDLDREQRRLEREEQKIITEIKQAAKRNEEKTVRVLAKNLTQIRKQKERLMLMKGNMKGMEYQGRIFCEDFSWSGPQFRRFLRCVCDSS